MLKSFAEINFIGKVLHGDIKPESIMVTFLDKEDEYKSKFEPVVTDFDMLISSAQKDVEPSLIRYTEGFRPPELSKEKENYKFSKEFVEDVYALGATIKSVIQTQQNFIDSSDCWILKLQELSSAMILNKEKSMISKNFLRQTTVSTVSDRKNMKDTLVDYLTMLAACSKKSPVSLNSQLFQKYLEPTSKLKLKRVLLV